MVTKINREFAHWFASPLTAANVRKSSTRIIKNQRACRVYLRAVFYNSHRFVRGKVHLHEKTDISAVFFKKKKLPHLHCSNSLYRLRQKKIRVSTWILALHITHAHWWTVFRFEQETNVINGPVWTRIVRMFQCTCFSALSTARVPMHKV